MDILSRVLNEQSVRYSVDNNFLPSHHPVSGLRDFFDKAKMPNYSSKKVTEKKGETKDAYEEQRIKQ